MNSRDLISKLDIVMKIVSKWETSKITNIERDIVLVKLQDTYEAILNASIETDTPAEEVTIIKTPIVEIVITEKVVEVVEEVVEQQVVSEDPTYVEPKEIVSVMSVRPVISRQMIHSLYGGDSENEESTQENNDSEAIESIAVEAAIVEEQTIEEQIIEEQIVEEVTTVPVVEYRASITIGDVISTNGSTIADIIGETIKSNDIASAVANSSSTTLKGSIGVNDKFLMLNDIFEGDITLYNTTIDALEEITDLDEALIFIHDNYEWNPSNRGVQLLIELLGRKLS